MMCSNSASFLINGRVWSMHQGSLDTCQPKRLVTLIKTDMTIIEIDTVT